MTGFLASYSHASTMWRERGKGEGGGRGGREGGGVSSVGSEGAVFMCSF